MILKKKSLVLLLGMCMMIALCSCKKGAGSENDASEETVQTRKEETTLLSGEATQITGNGTSVVMNGNGAMETDGMIRITSGGIYALQGEFQNFQVVVDAQKDDVVQLNLNGVNMTNENYAVINGVNCERLILNMAEETENTLSDGNEYQKQSDDDEVNAVIFSKDDISLAGTGTLVIYANYEDAVRSKDTLEIISGTYQVTSKKDAFQGKDELVVFDGVFSVNAGNDAFKASNSTDAGKGNLTIEKGKFNVEAGDDAFHAENVLTVNDGDINITNCYEGLEGIQVYVNGGRIVTWASDDGMNAAGGSDEGEDFFGKGGFGDVNEDAKVVINDGYVYVNAGGDGIDSNGNVEINGGIVLVDGPTNGGNGAVDYAISANVNGGYVVAVGSAMMASGFSESSKQYSWHYQTDGMQGTKEPLSVTNEAGEVLVFYQPTKEYQSVVVSIPEFTKGSSYQILFGGSATDADEYGFSKDADVSAAQVGGTIVIENMVNGSVTHGFGGRVPEGMIPPQAPTEMEQNLE